MRHGKRGQVTYEYLIVLGMILLLIIPFFNYAFFSVGVFMGTGGALQETVQLVQAMEEVYGLGPGSLFTVELKDVKEVNIMPSTEGKTIVVSKMPNGQEITLPSTAPFPGTVTLNSPIVYVTNNGGIISVGDRPTITRVDPQNLYILVGGFVSVYGTDLESTDKVSITRSDGSILFETAPSYLKVDGTQFDFDSSGITEEGTFDLYAIVDGVYSNDFSVQYTKTCGNNVKEGVEECDGTDDLACPGKCKKDCTCLGAVPKP